MTRSKTGLESESFTREKSVMDTYPKPKVSVIIPNYNHACSLPQRIQTILGQTF